MRKVMKFFSWWYVTFGFVGFVLLETAVVYYLMKTFGMLGH